ncbi:MAG: glycerol-3-phosphate 1-O-acyltransferase PlsY [Nitrospinota bacterium]
MQYLSAAVLSYLLGSLSPSIILGKVFKGIDIREHGSGNAGSTNSFRVLGKKAGITVLVFDILKGFLAVQIGRSLSTQETPDTLLLTLCGFSVIFGHIFTIFHSFRGGKGVNTAAGVMLGLMPLETIVAALIFLGVLRVSGYVSLGAIIASCSFPLILVVSTKALNTPQNSGLFFLAIVIPVLIIATHRENIRRLLSGNENKVSFFKKE